MQLNDGTWYHADEALIRVFVDAKLVAQNNPNDPRAHRELLDAEEAIREQGNLIPSLD